MRKIFAAVLALLLFLALPATVTAAEGTAVIGGIENDTWFTKYGNVNTSCSARDFVEELGFTWGDTVTVTFLDTALTLPVVPDYSYVESGQPAVIVRRDQEGKPEREVSLAINMGNFAEAYGLGKKLTDGDSWHWQAAENVSFPVEVTFRLAEKEGYLAQVLLHELNRTNERGDYPHLTDEEFANFRPILPGKLYRTCSPINPELGRNTYAQAALERAGVTVIMNLADTRQEAEGYPGFRDSYYARQKVVFLSLGIDVTEESFRAGLAKGLAFFAENEGVYAVHCTEGKDRAGFVSALLECFSGASYEEVVADYMTTYENYYGVEKDSEKYTAIAGSNIIKTLETAFGVEDLETADLQAEAEEYMRQIGLTDAQIGKLKENLGIPRKQDWIWPLIAVGALLILGAAVITVKKRRS